MYLPNNLYSSEQSRSLDRIAIDDFEQTDLMRRAGECVFEQIQQRWPDLASMTVFCGAGNNAGDGLVIASLAAKKDIQVQVVLLKDPDCFNEECSAYFAQLRETSADILSWSDYKHTPELTQEPAIIVDALLGTGFSGALKSDFEEAIDWINDSPLMVVAVDLPSGLNADTGCVETTAVIADLTVTFIGLKQGLFLADGPDYAGELSFDDLDIPADVYEHEPADLYRLTPESVEDLFIPRRRNTHKGNYGHVVVVGGNISMAGAVALSAMAALRVGAGRVSVLTHPDNQAIVHQFAPELMVHAVNSEYATDILDSADVIVLGPGLGTDEFAISVLELVCAFDDKTVVVDADALNLISEQDEIEETPHWIITPHPGEAARLLETDTQTVQSDRLAAVEELVELTGAVAVLKGSGTLIAQEDVPTCLCDAGNPGMATAGMGDVLAGVIAGFCAQGSENYDAACMGALIHAHAGDLAAEQHGERGMLASDLLPFLRLVVNQSG